MDGKELATALDEIKSGVLSLKDVQKAQEARLESAKADIEAIRQRLVDGGGVTVPGYKDSKECKDFSILKTVHARTTGDWKNAGLEKDVLAQHQKALDAMSEDDRAAYLGGEQGRAMGINSDAAGGFLVPLEQQAEIIEQVYANVAAIAAGVRVLEGLRGAPVTIPSQNSKGTIAEVAENAAISFNDLTFGQKSLYPRKLGGGFKVSREAVLLTSPAIEGLAREDLALQMARVLDLRILRGSGSSLQALGIANTAGIGSVALGTNGGPISYDAYIDLEFQLENADELRPGGRYAYVMHPRTRRNSRKLKDGHARPLYDESAERQNAFGSVMGHSVHTTTQIPTTLEKAGSGATLSEVYFGDWSQGLLGFWGPMRIEASMEAGDASGGAFGQDQVWVKAVRLYDFIVRRPAAFSLISDVS